MSSYIVTGFSNGQITLAFDGRQVNFPVPVKNGSYTEGAELDALLESYVAQARAAIQVAPVVADNEANILALVKEPSNDQKAAAIVKLRNQFLSFTDWTALQGNGLSTETATQWSIYRQALRDITKQSTFPTAPVWPVPPTPIVGLLGAVLTTVEGKPIGPLKYVW